MIFDFFNDIRNFLDIFLFFWCVPLVFALLTFQIDPPHLPLEEQTHALHSALSDLKVVSLIGLIWYLLGSYHSQPLEQWSICRRIRNTCRSSLVL